MKIKWIINTAINLNRKPRKKWGIINENLLAETIDKIRTEI